MSFDDALSAEMLAALQSQLGHNSWRQNRKWSLLDADATAEPHALAEGELRWTFGGPLVAEVIDRLDTLTKGIPAQQTMPTGDSAEGEQKESAEEGSAADVSTGQKNSDLPVSDPSKPIGDGPTVAWNGFWPLSVAEILDAVDVPNALQRSIGSGKPAALGNRYLAKLANEDTLFGWNAVILLAQRDPAAASEFVTVLERLVSNPPYYDPQTRQPVAAPENARLSAEQAQNSDSLPVPSEEDLSELSSEEILEHFQS